MGEGEGIFSPFFSTMEIQIVKYEILHMSSLIILGHCIKLNNKFLVVRAYE